jgi:hypothetical protein
LTAILFSALRASALFSSVTESTPFLKLVLILSVSIPSGTSNVRANEPKPTLPHVIPLLFLLSFFLLLALDRQNPICKRHLDISLVHPAGQFGGDLVSLVGLDEMDSRDRTESRPGSSGCDVQERVTTGG